MTDPLIPLQLHMEGCATQEEMNANVDATRARGFKGIMDLLSQFPGEVSIVGSGPTIEHTWRELRGDVLAINQAAGYLIDKNVIPKWVMLWDAAECVAEFAVPHPDVTYLVAARCHPKVFVRLKDCDVRVWFAGGDHNINDYMLQHKIREPLVNGGSAGVTRAMYLVTALGYKHIHIFGGDSSYADDGRTHVIKSLVEEKSLVAWIGNGEGRKAFRTTPEWCSQINEFRDIYHMFMHPQYRIEITVHGEGMMHHMWTLMETKKENGLLWKVDGSPQETTHKGEPHAATTCV